MKRGNWKYEKIGFLICIASMGGCTSGVCFFEGNSVINYISFLVGVIGFLTGFIVFCRSLE